MKELYRSLAAFQQEVPVIHKGTAGYGYTYADLTAIFDVINPLMKKHGIGFTQYVTDHQLCTVVFHVDSGEEIKACADIPQDVQLKGMNQFQVLGSAITYMRRYQLSAMLGLVTDKDTDASGEQVKKTPSSDKPWLNKGTDEWAAAIDYLEKGGVISKIEAKYRINKQNRQDLMDAVLS